MKKTLAIMLALIMVLALVPTVAFAETYVARIGETDYATLGEAVKAAKSGDTITLGEGEYTLYDVCGHIGAPGSSKDYTAGKDLTFIGQGEKTIWQIGSKTPDPEKEKGEFNGDYSFDGAGTVTFKKMTLRAPLKDSGKGWNYLGFIRADNTIVENCTMFGKTFYWGYKSAKFTNTTFNCPDDDYALWYYTGTEMSFDNCTFNASGKVIHAYREGTAENPLVLNFKDCKVVSSAVDKSVLNIKDANNYYTVNISGTNTVEGLKPNKITCSRLFQVEGWANNYNLSGGEGNSEKCQATVTIDGQTVWENGKMVGHAIGNQYTDGYKDNAFTVKPNANVPGSFEVKCIHCGYTEISTGELSNEIKLTRTVRQNSKSVSEDTPNSNKYKVANSSGITVDYTATMDMTNLEWKVAGKDVEEILGSEAGSPWELLMAQPDWITKDTVVFLTFKFDDKIDLETFQTNYNKAATADKEKLLKLESNMFKIADEGGVQFDIENQIENPKREMTIKCNWNWKKETGHDPAPTIILKGCGLPVKDKWGGNNQIDITNSGCVKGMVHINPRGGAAVAMVGPAPNVAANQESIPTPPLDTIQIPIVGGCKTDKFTLYYGGGSSGDSSGGGGYYYPTTTPVPVIVIPPKTGDMTIWQSILHFLGIK